MPGNGPTWIDGLVVLPDEDGRERLYASFVKVEAAAEGLRSRRWPFGTTTRSEFEKFRDVDMAAPILPDGHAFVTRRRRDYIYFAHPYPLVRVPATGEAFADPSQYEAFTCLKEGADSTTRQLDRDADGRLRYAWRKNTPPVGPAERRS